MSSVTGNLWVGGVAGSVDGNIENCYTMGNVVGKHRVGGIVGEIGSDGNIINCYVTGCIIGDEYVGGVAGSVSPGRGKVTNCAALNPSVNGINTQFGRVTGYIFGGNISNNVAWDGMLCKSTGHYYDDGTDKTNREIVAASFFKDLFMFEADEIDPWTYDFGKLPGLFGNIVNLPAHLKITPIAADLNFSIPSHTFNGEMLGFDIPIPVGMGAITVYYDGSETKPTNAGNYIITIDITEGDVFAAIQGLELGTYVIADTNEITSSDKFPPTNPLRAWIHSGVLHVTGLSCGETLSVYSVTGMLLYHNIATNDEMNIPLRMQGMYIVRVENNTVKVVNE
jgi:hypothetical protein